MSKFFVGFSGAQGAGKTTLLAELAKRGYTVDDFKVSRTVQEQLGWSDLKQVLSSPEVMMDFQQRVLEAKLENDHRLSRFSSNHTTLTERTFADIVAYTMSWSWQLVDSRAWTFGEATRFLTPFIRECLDAQQKCYDAVVVVPFMPHVIFEEDHRRAPRSTVDGVFADMTRFLDTHDLASTPRCTINTKTVEERADQVRSFLETL